MRVLLVEPYLGGSHADWAEGLARHSAHEVVAVGHPGRHWRWRMRGGPVTLAEQADRAVQGIDLTLDGIAVNISRWSPLLFF